MTTLEELFKSASHIPTFEQVFGKSAPKTNDGKREAGKERYPAVCCVTGVRINRRGDHKTRYRLNGDYYVFATRKLSDARKAALDELAKAGPPKPETGKPIKSVKDTDNG